MPSFDVVSELDQHEVTNAIDNAVKELERRYVLRGKCSLESKEKTLNSTHQCNAHPCIHFVRRLPAQAFARA